MQKSLILLFVLSLSLYANPNEKCAKALRRAGLEKQASNFLDDPFEVVKGRDVVASEGVVLKRWDEKLGTTVYFTASEPGKDGKVPLVDPKSDAVVVFFHGSGTEKSSGRNFLHNMNFIAANNLSGVAIDLPAHGTQKGGQNLGNKADFLKWLHSFMKEVKASGKPVILAGHSFGPTVESLYAANFPKYVDKVLLISPSFEQEKGMAWMYQNVTDPGMKYIGGNEEVKENEAGGLWAGKLGPQLDIVKKDRIPPEVEVHLVVGKMDEWWPPAQPGVPLPKQVREVKITNPNPNLLGNSGVAQKLGIQPKYNFNDSMNWFLEQVPHAKVDVIDGVGHYIFDAKTKDGISYINQKLLDVAGVERKNTKLSDSRTAKTQLAIMYENNHAFRKWLGNRYEQVARSEVDSKGVLDNWTHIESEVWRQTLNSIKEKYPDYYAQRKYWVAKALKDTEAALESKNPVRGAPISDFQADFRSYLQAKELNAPTNSFPPDPYKRSLPPVDKEILGSAAIADRGKGAITFSNFEAAAKRQGNVSIVEVNPVNSALSKIKFESRGKSYEKYVLSKMSEAEAVEFLSRAYENAWEKNGFLSPGDEWVGEVDGVRVKARVNRAKDGEITGFTRMELEPVAQAN